MRHDSLFTATSATTEPLERLARRRASAKLGWYVHAAAYLLVIPLLWALAAATGTRWAVFPTLGWGLGLAVHGVAVFVLAGGGGLHERLVQAERERIARQRAAS